MFRRCGNMIEDFKTRFIRLFALIIKEFHSVWRDPKSRSLLFIPPIVQLFLFSHAATLDIENISLAVLNEDSTPVSREFLSRISGSKYFKKIIYVKNLDELKNALDTETVRGALYIKMIYKEISCRKFGCKLWRGRYGAYFGRAAYKRKPDNRGIFNPNCSGFFKNRAD